LLVDRLVQLELRGLHALDELDIASARRREKKDDSLPEDLGCGTEGAVDRGNEICSLPKTTGNSG
jgi:hypothetical protein